MQGSIFFRFFATFAVFLLFFAVVDSFFLPFFCPSGACNLLNTNKEKNFCVKRILYWEKCIFAVSNKQKNKVMKKQRKEKRLKRQAAKRIRMIECEAYLDYITEYKNK